MKYNFSGPLASFIERHLELQRALGFQQRNAAYTLAAFDRYLIEHFPKAQPITQPMVVEFLKTTGHLQTNTRSMRLWIKETKHHKSRLVPLSASSAQALNSYAELRVRHRCDTQPTAPFFVGADGKRWQYNTIKKIFGRLVRQLGLRTQQGSAPRLHDLRHSFATRCLAGFYQSGKDPNSHLPVLATFLGHARVTYTALYLHPQAELLKVAGARFKEHIRQVGKLSLGGGDATS